jgi:hypothetical protein
VSSHFKSPRQVARWLSCLIILLTFRVLLTIDVCSYVDMCEQYLRFWCTKAILPATESCLGGTSFAEMVLWTELESALLLALLDYRSGLVRVCYAESTKKDLE